MDFAIFELSIEFQNFPRSVQTIKLTSVKYTNIKDQVGGDEPPTANARLCHRKQTSSTLTEISRTSSWTRSIMSHAVENSKLAPTHASAFRQKTCVTTIVVTAKNNNTVLHVDFYISTRDHSPFS